MDDTAFPPADKLVAPGIRWAAPAWGLTVVGLAAAVAAILTDHAAARSAAAQVWSPFVLVAGLLMVGLVADQDGLFAAIGHRLASVAPNGTVLFAGASLGIATVTAVLNLDTSVVFVTPVLVYAARSRGQDGSALLMASLLLSNAGSVLLPGSNLTNLIVLGHLHLSGGQFLEHMALPWTAAVLVTGGAIAVTEHRSLSIGPAASEPGPAMTVGLGALGVAAVVVLVLVLQAPAVPVAGVGVVAAAIGLAGKRLDLDRVRQVLGVPVLVGLFGIALALGALGRSWLGPATLLAHLDAVGVAAVAAGTSVVVNNLPAAALLAARVPAHPFALLVGLDIGPNLFVTGSLAWILWWRTARSLGVSPPVRKTAVLGILTVPLSMGAALAILAVTGTP